MIQSLIDAAVKTLKVAAWIAVAGAATAILGALGDGELALHPELLPWVNLALVFVAKFATSQRSA